MPHPGLPGVLTMSGGRACRVKEHRIRWRVTVYKGNYSAFNGGHYTPSAYSEVMCPDCSCRWRTKAAYVETLPYIGRWAQ